MITVLIRCSSDYRVLNCIRSIKTTSPDTPIVVSMTPDKKLFNLVLKSGAISCVVPKYNAAITNIKGLSLVKTKKVIITDADTIFEKNTVKLLDSALDKYDVVKPKLVFRSKMRISYLTAVSNLRTFFNDKERKMYIPGVAFNLDIKNKIGGYYFDKKIPWGEDSDFSDRVTEKGLKTKVIKSAVLYHPSVNIIHDLADAFLIGMKKGKNSNIYKTASKRFRFYKKLLRKTGVPTLLYGMVWYLFFDMGKVIRNYNFLKSKSEGISWDILSKPGKNE